MDSNASISKEANAVNSSNNIFRSCKAKADNAVVIELCAINGKVSPLTGFISSPKRERIKCASGITSPIPVEP